MSRAPALLVAISLLSCAAPRGVDPDAIEATHTGAASLMRLARDFYERLSNRRFDSIATYQDPALREFFRSPEAFADYYAELARVLGDAHFDAKRVTSIEVESLEFEQPTSARMTVRYRGEDGRPLRFWATGLVREELWKREQERWWIIPGKL